MTFEKEFCFCCNKIVGPICPVCYKNRIKKTIEELENSEDALVDEASDDMYINATELKKRLHL